MKEQVSLLKQERLKRNWSRAKVEALTEGRIPISSLERWEEKKSWPRGDSIEVLCKLYGKSAKELGLDRSGGIMTVENTNASTSQEETPMSDLIRRSALSDLGSYLFGLVSTWPRRNHHYEELQDGINKAVTQYNMIVGQDAIAALNRRQALKSLGLVPIQLMGGVELIGKTKKTDTDSLLAHCAAGITAAWYIWRGKELVFVSDLTSSYISILKPLANSHSEAYRKSSAKLLAQCFGLKSKLTNALQDDDQAIAYEEEAIRYALLAENVTEQAIANREMASLYWRRKKYKLALPYAETAYGLAKSNKATPKIIISFTASGLASCQASSGYLADAQISLKEAHDLFDPTMLMPSMPYGQATLSETDARIYQHMGNFKEAIAIYQQYKTFPTTVLGDIQNNIEYAETEVSRDDKPRDMGLCITLLTEAIAGATELDSQWYKREARECYNLLRIAWPREDAIKTLGKDHFGLR